MNSASEPNARSSLTSALPASSRRPATTTFAPYPDELVWSHMKRTGVARAALRRGEKLQAKIEAQLSAIKRMPQLIRSFFRAPSVSYITDW